VLGVILAGIDRRTRLSRELTTYVERVFNRPKAIPRRLEPSIPTAQELCNAQEQGRTIFDHKPTSSVAQSYLELAKTIETQLKRIQAKQAKIVKELSDTEVQAISDEVRADLN
jgi:nitrogenase subunit NifH